VCALVLTNIACRDADPREASGDAGGDDAAIAWGFGAGACAGESVAPAPLRPLTAVEYDASVRDLFGVSSRPALAFLPEPSPLDREGGVFGVTAAHALQYQRAAERVAREARPYFQALAREACAGEPSHMCFARLVRQVGRRVWRRPLGVEEERRLLAVGGKVAAEGVVDALQLVVEVMLQAPQFLYRLEWGEVLAPGASDSGGAGGAVVRVTDHELATRLSFLLWGTTPDDALLDAADAGALEGTGLQVQVARLLDDPRATDRMTNFVRAWFGHDAVLGLAKDTDLFPGFTPDAARRMVDETDRWVVHALDDPREGMLEAFLPGMLLQPSLLASLAHPTQGSPVRRGYFVRTRVLCQSLPPPPPDVVFAVPEPSDGTTTRERFADLRDQPMCSTCHDRIDPIGYLFEHYDAVGAWREREGGQPIDARGFLAGTDVDGEYDDARVLAAALGTSTIVRDCAVAQAFRWGVGRAEGEGDACAVAAMGQAFARGGYRVRDLLVALAGSEAFRMRPTPSVEGACP
jgi:hypothetical protein